MQVQDGTILRPTFPRADRRPSMVGAGLTLDTSDPAFSRRGLLDLRHLLTTENDAWPVDTDDVAFLRLHRPKEADLVTKVKEVAQRRRQWMTLKELIAKNEIPPNSEASNFPVVPRKHFTHLKLGAGITATYSGMVGKDYVLELSNGHAVVEPGESSDAGWALAISKKKVKLEGWLMKAELESWTPRCFPQGTLPWVASPLGPEAWARNETLDTEIEIYE